MALQVGALVLVTYRGEYAGQRILFNTIWRVTGTASVADDFQDLGDIATYFAGPGAGSPCSAYLACLPSNYGLSEVRAQKISPQRSVYVTANTSLAGTFDDIATTGNLQHPLTFHTELAGRDEISVKKIGPAPASSHENGAPTNAYRNLLDVLGNEFLATQTAGFNNIALRMALPRANLTQSEFLIGHRVPTRTGTMRRRTLRVGE